MIHRNGLVWVAMFAVIALMFLQLPPMAAKQDSVYHTYSALVEVDALARQKFVVPIEGDKLVDGAIRGMMYQLDPYSGYIAPDELAAFDRRNKGVFIGVGIELGMRAGKPIVIAPIDGSPAAKAGVRAGDVMIAIDGKILQDRAVFDIEEMLVGRAGTPVTVTVRRVAETAHVTIEMVRGPVSVSSVRGFRRLEGGTWDFMLEPETRIGYIRVSSFRENTQRDFARALSELLKGGARALILDLRFNPGGLMEQAIEMVDRFVDSGVILSTVTRRRAVDEYRAKSPDTADEIAIVVLIHGSSASSAEIVAGSLQALGRAVVVGERSFGKGSVQHMIRLTGHRSAIKLTVAYYRLPDGRIIHRTAENSASDAWGILPDVEVVLSSDEVRALQASRHALDTAGPALAQDRDHPEATASGYTRELIRDRQLSEAIRQARDLLAGRTAPTRLSKHATTYRNQP
ncbi:MAG: S41 family peptidase [Planctomycetes bacterium]|nr:S41 family peptidase [Planctomycetota bacterium]